MNKLMIFEGKNVEVFEYEGQVLFNPKHVAECLDIKNVNDAIRGFNEKQKIKLKNSDVQGMHFRKLNNAGENFLTESGVKTLISKSLSTKKEEVLKALGFNEFIIVNRLETSFGQTLTETLKPMNIKLELQKSMFGGKYRIDFYIPKYKLAIEYDEEHHKKQKEADLNRQTEIETELNCKFIRLDYNNSDNFNVGIVLNEIIKGMGV